MHKQVLIYLTWEYVALVEYWAFARRRKEEKWQRYDWVRSVFIVNKKVSKLINKANKTIIILLTQEHKPGKTLSEFVSVAQVPSHIEVTYILTTICPSMLDDWVGDCTYHSIAFDEFVLVIYSLIELSENCYNYSRLTYRVVNIVDFCAKSVIYLRWILGQLSNSKHIIWIYLTEDFKNDLFDNWA